MSHHKTVRRKNAQSGFTMIETLAAIVVLSIGLVGMAVLMSNMMTGGARSRYMSNAAMLASEELENLQRFSAGPNPTDQTGADPEIAVTSGSTAGSLDQRRDRDGHCQRQYGYCRLFRYRTTVFNRRSRCRNLFG